MLLVPQEDRDALWRRLIEIIEGYTADVGSLPVAPALDPPGLRGLLEPFDFERPMAPLGALDFAADALRRHQVHTPHPRYFGLFNPAPTTMGIAADALVAAFNPQIAAWSHSPFAAETERHVVRHLARRFGYALETADGIFASGGAEANHTAVLAALSHVFPEFARAGVRGLPAQPVLYVSAEAHHSFLKAARLCGLGTDAVREVPVDGALAMDAGALSSAIVYDRERGLAPFLVVATAGTTSAGAVDPIRTLADVAGREGVWLHVDAAWGGAAVLVPELRGLLDGVERSDSITFDAHKWLSLPMGAGLFLTRHPDILERTFRVDTGYMPKEAAGLDVGDPFARSMQWSRRFIGLKLFLSLAVAGWQGYAASVRHMTAMGRLLRERLESAGWEVVNRTPLPVVCFVDARDPRGREAATVHATAQAIVASGRAWISTVTLAGGAPALRACITNHRTGPDDVEALVTAVNEARRLPAILRG